MRLPVYVAYKRRVILYGSFFLGPALAFAGRVTLFRAMGFAEMPAALDMILTGIIIGSGSEPVHGLVSSMGGLGRALGTLGDLARRGSASDAVTVAVKTAATGDAARDEAGVQVTATGRARARRRAPARLRGLPSRSRASRSHCASRAAARVAEGASAAL